MLKSEKNKLFVNYLKSGNRDALGLLKYNRLVNENVKACYMLVGQAKFEQVHNYNDHLETLKCGLVYDDVYQQVSYKQVLDALDNIIIKHNNLAFMNGLDLSEPDQFIYAVKRLVERIYTTTKFDCYAKLSV